MQRFRVDVCHAVTVIGYAHDRNGWKADIAIGGGDNHPAPMGEVTVNFVAFDDERDACLMVLVEEGPWGDKVHDNLSRLQGRLYGCLDAALDGQLAESFPQSKGKTIVVRVDCYDLPQTTIDDFIQRFSEAVASLSEYSADASPFVREFHFEVNHDTLMGT